MEAGAKKSNPVQAISKAIERAQNQDVAARAGLALIHADKMADALEGVKQEMKADGFSDEDIQKIVGAQQVWFFNAKTRNLTVINAMSHAGLSIKGTTIIGFDEKTSVTKKLRKPEQTLEILKAGSKIVLRKLMDNIKCKPVVAKGRLNTDTVILRAVK